MSKGDIIVDCDNCGESFNITAKRAESNSNCCSISCRAELKKSLKINNVVCYVCKKDFYIKPSKFNKLSDESKIACSINCSSVIRKNAMSGEKNHQFGIKGELNSSYQSDIRISSHGYVLIRYVNHPFCHSDGYILMHRMIYEEYLKSINDYQYLIDFNGVWVLNPSFVIHHKDENKLNNSLSNLEITTLSEHSARHSENRNIVRDSSGKIVTVVGEIKSGNLTRNKRLDAGQDVKASRAITIPAKGDSIVFTDLFVNVPEGHVGLLWSRSGLSVKHKIEVGAGCIDSGYNGEILVHLYNHSDTPYSIEIGDKIAQLLTIPVNLNNYAQVKEFSLESERGSNGFNSSGY
jgi:dUTP pyrophosphatase